jgi:hypothetical protein
VHHGVACRVQRAPRTEALQQLCSDIKALLSSHCDGFIGQKNSTEKTLVIFLVDLFLVDFNVIIVNLNNVLILVDEQHL